MFLSGRKGGSTRVVFDRPFFFKISKRHIKQNENILDQGYTKIRLIRSLKKFILRYQDLVEIYSVSAEKIINDGFSYSENV